MGDQVAFLGVKGGPAIRPGSSMPTSFLFHLNNTPIIIDCGLGVTSALVRQNFNLEDLRTIIISHLHSDHYLELGPLLHTAWTAGLKNKVVIYGPKRLKDYWLHFYNSMSDDIELRIEDEGRIPLFDLVEIKPITTLEDININGISISFLRNVHPPIEDSFAMRFETDTVKIVYSGDTRYYEPMIYFSQNVDLLIHEVMYLPAIDALCERVGNSDNRLKQHLLNSHTTIEEAARLAQLAAVKELAFCHYVPGDDAEFPLSEWEKAARREYKGKISMPRDGDIIKLN